MVGQVQPGAAAELESEKTAAAPSSSACRNPRYYSAFPFSVLLQRLTRVASCESAASTDGCCRTRPLGGPGPAVVRPPQTILLLLPICKACASAPDCSSSSCLTSGMPCRSCGGFAELSGRVAGTRTPPGHCGTCNSTLLLLVLLRLGIHSLKEASSADGILFCGSDEAPERHRRFFPLLLGTEDQWPWSNLPWPEAATGTSRRTRACAEAISLSSGREDYLALTRIGYKLLPKPSDLCPPETKHSPATPQLPPLLRFMAELPEALYRPPALLLLSQPSRWLKPVQQARTKAPVLQHFTDTRSYGLFLALLQRAAAVGGQSRSFVLGGRQQATFTAPPITRAAVEEERQQNSVPGCAVVAECFLCCPSCCWRCTGPLQVIGTGYASLCCLEHSEWLCMLRSRFSQVLLLFYGSLDPPAGEQRTAVAASPGKAAAESACVLFIADVTDMASHVLKGSG